MNDWMPLAKHANLQMNINLSRLSIPFKHLGREQHSGRSLIFFEPKNFVFEEIGRACEYKVFPEEEDKLCAAYDTVLYPASHNTLVPEKLAP